MIKELNEVKICNDVIFKAIFLREKEILLKMIYDITNIRETVLYEEVITGYELEPYNVKGKTNKSDMLVKIGDNYFVNLEINYRHEKNVLFRNMIQLFRISIQISESGMTDNELAKKEIAQLNFNTFSNINNKEIHKGYYSDEDGNILNNLLTFWNIDIVKCYEKVYNNIEDVQKLPKAVRWGALLYMNVNNIEMIKKVIGDDLLTMEDRVKLISRIGDVIDDKRIIQEWMVIENNRLREKNILETAKEEAMEEGFKEGIEKGIEQGIEKGIEKGIEQGTENNKIEIIKNLLREGSDYNFISRVTNKSIDDIIKIEKTLE